MSTRPQTPLDAKVLPDSPPPRSAGSNVWNWILASSAFFGFVALFAILLWGLGHWIGGSRRLAPGRHGSLVQHWETPSQRLTAVKAALEARDVGCSPAELRELDRFFARVATGVRSAAAAQLDSLIDLDALTDRILRHPALEKVDRSARERLRRQMEYDAKGVPPWTRFSVVSVTRGPRDELLVYTIAAGYELEPSPVRWWLKRQGRSWRICDWERIDVGYSEAQRRALDEALLARGEQAPFRKATAAIAGAITNRRADNIPLAAQQLLDVQNSEPPDLVHDLLNIDLAFVWQTCSRPDQVIAACNRIRDSKANPAVHYLRALAHAEREQFAETVAEAAAYREAAGRHPHLLEVEAQALEALGRPQDAARCWQDRLAVFQDDGQALAEVCRLAGENSATALAAILQENRAPIELALAAGSAAARKQDHATYEAVAQYLRTTPRGSAAIERLIGERLAQDGEYQRAAEHFHKAFQAAGEPAARRESFQRYLDAMARSGRAVAGYAAAANPTEAFTMLTAGVEEGEAPITFDDLPLLLAAHRQRGPGDVNLHFYQGLLDLVEGRPEAAERSLAAGEASAEDDELRQRLRSKRLDALYQQGRLSDAYQAYGSDQELMFRELAWLCHRDRNWKALDELAKLHRQQQADDPWIDYFLALKHEAQGNDAEALAAVRRAEESKGESLGPQLDWLKNNLLIRVEGITQAYLNSGDQREAFRRLVSHLAAAEDWDGILELTELHANSGGGVRRSSTIYWAAKAQWNCGEYEKIVASLSPWPYDRLARLDGQQIAELYDIVVRSLLRLGRIDEAEQTARQARDEYGLELPQMAVALAKRDRDAVQELLEQRRIARALFHQPLYRDRDLASLLTDPDATEIRRQHGLAWPEEHAPRNVSLALLYEQPLPASDVEVCRELADGLGAAIEIVAADGRRSWLWNVGADTLVLTHASSAYCNCDELPDWLPPDDPRREILEQHGGWAAVDLLLADQAIRNSKVRPAAANLAAALAARGAQACYVAGPRGRIGQPTLIDASAIQQMGSGEIFLAQPGATMSESLFVSPPAVFERTTLPRSQIERELTRLALGSRVARAQGHARIRVRPTRGHAAEDLWLKVIRSRSELLQGGEGEEEFIAEMTTDSQLWPHLKIGERVIVGIQEPLEVAPLVVAPDSASPAEGK